MTDNQTHLPCPSCPSSDAFMVDGKDGHGFCFSCGIRLDKEEFDVPEQTTTKSASKVDINEEYAKGYIRNLPERGLSIDTIKKYSVRITKNNSHHYYPYYNPQDEFKYVKIRQVEDKKFLSFGETNDLQLFGMQAFSGGGKRVTVCEGEIDAMSVYEMFGRLYPAVSVRSSVTAERDCGIEANYKWLNSFSEIIICFDNDEAGQKAAVRVAQMFDSSKVKLVNMTLKDPNEYLMSRKVEQFKKEWWDAQKYTPDGIISSPDEFWELAHKDLQASKVEYPWAKLNSAAYGIRKGEAILVTAPEGVGKTQVMRELEWQILHTQEEDSIGIIHLEENAARTVRGLMSMAANKPLHLPDTEYTEKEFADAFAKTFGTGRVHMFSNFDHNSFAAIESRIRYMARVHGCGYFVLDHISILVSDQEEIGDERKTLDAISTKLRFLCQELDVCIIMVSHVNDTGQTRGSRNISKVADIWIHLERDHLAEDERVRNTTILTIKKNRFSGITGFMGKLYFDADTSRLVDITFEEQDSVDLPAEVTFDDIGVTK